MQSPRPISALSVARTPVLKSGDFDRIDCMLMKRALMSLRAAAGLVVVALLTLTVVYWYSDRRSEYPDAPELARPFMCEKCRHVFELTPKQRVELEKDAAYEVPDDRVQGTLLLPCPACREKAARDAWQCPNCGDVHLPPRYKSPRECPSCGRKSG